MHKRIFAFFALAFVLGGIGLGALAADATAYNARITDQGIGLIAWFTRVSFLPFDPDSTATDACTTTICRLPADPIQASTLVVDRPRDAIQVTLPTGHYWMLVWVEFVESPVPYVSFEVVDGQTTSVDLTQVPFPQELVTY